MTERFFALDFDRTLCDTDKVVQSLESFLEAEYPGLAARIHAERQRVEESGGSYDVVSTLEQDETVSVDAVLEHFVESERAHGRDFLLPGAQELLEAISLNRDGKGIVTYGGEKWQRTKLQLTGLGEESALIIDRKGKGERIASWRDRDGIYHLPKELGGRAVDEVIIVDDKPIELKGLPHDQTARGYLIHNADRSLPSQWGEIDDDVTKVGSLLEVIDHEF